MLDLVIKPLLEIMFKRKRNTSQLQWLKNLSILVMMTFLLTMLVYKIKVEKIKN